MLSAVTAGLALAAAIASPGAPAPAAPAASPTWTNVVQDPSFTVDVDTKSVKLVVRNSGFEMASRMRMNFGAPFVIPGKTKLGAYYVNEVAAKCRDDTFVIHKSTAYSADGEVLATGKDVAVIKNPKNPKSFISVWMHLACNQFKGKRPPTVI